VSLQVIRGDGKGTVPGGNKYGDLAILWQGPATIIDYRPLISLEKMPHINKSTAIMGPR
jgi:hypothetical protein